MDGEGTLFAELPEEPPPAAAELPMVTDARLGSLPREVGDVLDPVTLDAALRLGSLTPADVGSAARDLVLRVDDTNGFTMRTRPASWTAVFGFYTPTLRTTELVPGQVRLLRSLLAGREPSVAKVVLPTTRAGRTCPSRRRRPRAATARSAPRSPGSRPSRAPPPRPTRATRHPPRRRRDPPRVGYRRGDVHPAGGCPPVLLPLVGLLIGVMAGLLLNVNVSFEFSRYSAVAILAALDSVLGAVRAELDGVYDNRIFVSGFITNAVVAVLLTFIGDRLGLDLYLVALINFGFRIFNNVALIRRHFI